MAKLMRGTKAFVVTGLILAAVLLAGGVILSGLSGPASAPEAQDAAPDAAPGAGTGGLSPGPGPAPGEYTAEDTASAPGARPPAASPDPERPLEVPPGAAAAGAGTLPASRVLPEAKTLLEPPLPPADAAEGRLVDAFPEHVLPLSPGTRILASSIASSGNTLQAGLRASSSSGTVDVLAFYASHFQSLGFQPGAPETAGGTTTAVWSYGASAVTVSVGPATGGADLPYSVFAVLRAGV
ncbi:hypothetical protein [Arthrobacter luteolus]|uniref:hypothetical protein n=1 Tax=Arthrobacter luteolus TaxID=98672 RepID=UPI000835B8A4|nr:hypothetical protein [Arthrobacter luteolus]